MFGDPKIPTILSPYYGIMKLIFNFLNLNGNLQYDHSNETHSVLRCLVVGNISEFTNNFNNFVEFFRGYTLRVKLLLLVDHNISNNANLFTS